MSYQQIFLLGNVGDKDGELRYTPGGKAVASFSMATNKTWTDGNGERQSKSIWWRITAWDQLANFIGEHIKAKMPIMVIGEVEEARPFTDREGNQRASLEVRALTIKFVGSRTDQGDGEAQTKPTRQQASSSNRAGSYAAPSRDDADIPFFE